MKPSSQALIRMALALTAVAHFAFAPAAASATPFFVETPDTSYALYPSAVYDGAGNPHLSWLAFASQDSRVRYATRRHNAWIVEDVATVSASLYTYSWTSIALDPAGDPHIAFYDNHGTTGELLYASRTSSGWVVDTVDIGGDVGSHASLAIGPTGIAHISYYDATNEQLKYAFNEGGWNTETVGTAVEVGYFTSIAVDPTERPHISYYDYAHGDLKYATRQEPDGPTWTIQTVDTTGTTGQYTSIAVDARGNPSISYYDLTRRDVRYAFKVGSSWTTEAVDTAGNVGQSTCLRLDSQGGAHVAYVDLTNNHEKYASRSAAGVWTTETVDASSRAAWFGVALALDPQDNPALAYWSDGDAREYFRFADATVRLTGPAGVGTWPVGALRNVEWTGAGSVSIFLSADGGATYDELVDHTDARLVPIRVPDLATSYARLKIVRDSPLSYDVSDSLFTISSSVGLLTFSVTPAAGGGVTVAWQTDPGPADLAGYKLERSDDGTHWQTLTALQSQTTFADRQGSELSRYRLTAINYYGHEVPVGGNTATPGRALSVWPVPFSAGSLHISFASEAAGEPSDAVEVFDVSGRLVKSLARGPLQAGVHELSWDGRDAGGAPAARGLYFLRLRQAGHESSSKIIVER